MTFHSLTRTHNGNQSTFTLFTLCIWHSVVKFTWSKGNGPKEFISYFGLRWRSLNSHTDQFINECQWLSNYVNQLIVIAYIKLCRFLFFLLFSVSFFGVFGCVCFLCCCCCCSLDCFLSVCFETDSSVSQLGFRLEMQPRMTLNSRIPLP